jgi:hypothetical protein
MGVTIIKGFAGGLFNALWSVKIRLPYFHVDDMDTLTFHFMGLFKDVHNDKRSHFFGSL